MQWMRLSSQVNCIVKYEDPGPVTLAGNGKGSGHRKTRAGARVTKNWPVGVVVMLLDGLLDIFKAVVVFIAQFLRLTKQKVHYHKSRCG